MPILHAPPVPSAPAMCAQPPLSMPPMCLPGWVYGCLAGHGQLVGWEARTLADMSSSAFLPAYRCLELTSAATCHLAGPLQVSLEIQFGREDDDEMKVKAMEFFLPRGEQVRCGGAGWLWGCPRCPHNLRAAPSLQPCLLDGRCCCPPPACRPHSFSSSPHPRAGVGQDFGGAARGGTPRRRLQAGCQHEGGIPGGWDGSGSRQPHGRRWVGMGEKPRALVLVHCCRSHIEIPKNRDLAGCWFVWIALPTLLLCWLLRCSRAGPRGRRRPRLWRRWRPGAGQR